MYHFQPKIISLIVSFLFISNSLFASKDIDSHLNANSCDFPSMEFQSQPGNGSTGNGSNDNPAYGDDYGDDGSGPNETPNEGSPADGEIPGSNDNPGSDDTNGSDSPSGPAEIPQDGGGCDDDSGFGTEDNPGSEGETGNAGDDPNDENSGGNITGVEDFTKIPNQVELLQNYPNPFNPTTKIEFTITEPMFVELIVYDLLGKKIIPLLRGQKSAGKYIVNFNAEGLSSGVYFYSLKTKYSLITKKFILSK